MSDGKGFNFPAKCAVLSFGGVTPLTPVIFAPHLDLSTSSSLYLDWF